MCYQILIISSNPQFHKLRFCFRFFNRNYPPIMDVDSIRDDDQLDEETISDSFICCVCLDLFYKPIVLECGHISCFWCVHKSMDPCHPSHCPICRNPYRYFPTICEMLHFLIIKMYPVAYRRREKQVLEEEKETGAFSPQLSGQEVNSIGGSKASKGEISLSDMPSVSCVIKEEKHRERLFIDGSVVIKDNNLLANSYDKSRISVSSTDLLCPACKQLLFRPAALNCGHVLCEACIIVPEDGVIICEVCEIPNPSDRPNICLELNNFLEEQFPDEYAVRKEIGEKNAVRKEIGAKNPTSCCTSEKSAKKSFRICKDEAGVLPWFKEYGAKIHYGVGCDYCGMYPIVGDRYICKDCVEAEAMGFDLCGDCYKTSSKRPGRFNQQHTPDHRFELVDLQKNDTNLMLRLFSGHMLNSSGAPVLGMSAAEDTSDGWVAVDSADFRQNIGENDSAVFPEGNRSDFTLDEFLGGSVPLEFIDPEISDAMEFSDAPESTGGYVDSVEEQGEDSTSTA